MGNAIIFIILNFIPNIPIIQSVDNTAINKLSEQIIVPLRLLIVIVNIMITIPNSIITNVKIVNQSTPKQNFRIHIKVGVAYNSDLEKVEETLVQVALDNPLACRTPPPKVRLRTFGEYAINYEPLSWAIRPHDRGRLTHELSKEIHKRFKENGIEIPLPQRVVQLQHDKVTPTSFRKNTP